MRSIIGTDNKKTELRYRITLVIVMALTVALVVIEHIYQRQVFKLSIKVSIELQKLHIYGICYFFSHVFFYTIIMYVPLAFIVREIKTRYLLHFIELFVGIYIYTLLKMVMRESRPSFESADLKGTKGFCEPDYGSPSGHSAIAVNLFLIIASDISYKMRSSAKVLIYFTCVSMALIICMSRLYFGVHSIDQTLLGMSCGFCVFLFFEGNKSMITDKFIRPVLLKDKSNAQSTRNLLIKTLVAVNMVTYCLWIACYYIETYRADSFNFVQNCHSVFQRYPNFSSRLIVQSFTVNIPLGCILGMFDSKHDIGTNINFYYDRSLVRFFVRLLTAASLYILVSLICFPSNSNLLVIIIKANLAEFFSGYFVGRYILSVFDVLGISYKSKTDAQHSGENRGEKYKLE